MLAPKCHFGALVVVAACGATEGSAQPVDRRLGELSLEELSNIEITSVSKRAERLSFAPSSVFVITGADIRRSGVTSLAEALRLAPNLHVASVGNSGHAISARGFNGGAANKLLVLIDGRSVYTPLFSGVFWDVQDVVLEDVDRIEVISGPGSTLWGVNAVNGVINVITRESAASQGGMAAGSLGRLESRASGRFGGKATNGLAWRLYGTRVDFQDTETASGAVVNDAGHHTLAGWRADAQRGDDRLMLQAEAYRGRREQPLPGSISISGVDIPLGPIDVSGAHLLGQWQHPLSDGASWQLQAYLDHTERTVVPTFSDRQDTLDLQFQHSLGSFGGHAPVWGMQYRRGWDRTGKNVYVAFLPEHLNQTWASLFVQDDITLADNLRLTAGLRAEHNSYTGTELLPSLRLGWNLASQQLLWGAASRTARAPSRLDHDTFVPGQPPFLLRGGSTVRSETATVFELGYRGQPTSNTSLSVTAYQADYDHLRTQQIDPGYTYIFFANGMEGRTSGVELWGSYQVLPSWRLHAGYNRLWQDLRLKPWSNDADAVAVAEGANPSQWWQLRSAVDIGDQVELDLMLRHVGALAQPRVPAYTALDLRVGWQPSPVWQLSLVGQNLIGHGHGEFTDVSTRTQLRRALLVKAEWHF